MSNPVYLISQSTPSTFPFEELKQGQQYYPIEHLTQVPQEQAAASSSLCPHDHQTQLKVNTHELEDISSAAGRVAPSSLTSPGTNWGNCRNDIDGSVRWIETKARLRIGKMVNYLTTSTSDDYQRKSTRVVQENSEEFITSGDDIVRVCSDCNTTKTPLWRSGPRGPKSLCNACGIRQRKARRAMAAAEAASSGIVSGATTSYKVQNKEKKSRTSYIDSQTKKQCDNLISTATNSLDNDKKFNKFEEFAISLRKNSAFRRVFPSDEEEAAVLLMALSCGLIHG